VVTQNNQEERTKILKINRAHLQKMFDSMETGNILEEGDDSFFKQEFWYSLFLRIIHLIQLTTMF